MKIAVGQISPKDGDINQNLQEHYRLINLAAHNGVKLIVFPEMSITGYARESAKELSFAEDDSRLDNLRKLAADNGIIIVAGAPIRIGDALYIGSFVIFPDSSISIYTKQFLHSGEEEFFSSSFSYNPIIKLDNERISLAICADIDNSTHAKNASQSNSTIYIASIFFTQAGMTEAHNLLSTYAKNFSMDIFMSNFCWESWGLKSGGKSAFWSKNGDFIAGLDTLSTGLVIGEKSNGVWSGTVIEDR